MYEQPRLFAVVLCVCWRCVAQRLNHRLQMGTAIVSGRVTDEQSAAIADTPKWSLRISIQIEPLPELPTQMHYTTRIMHVVGI